MVFGVFDAMIATFFLLFGYGWRFKSMLLYCTWAAPVAKWNATHP
jgi:hypothetical protein